MAASTGNTGNNNGRKGRVENLIPWRPGQSGNPSGRPKRKPITDAYKRMLAEIDTKTGKTIAEGIARAMILEALKGSHLHAKEITDRVEGSVRQALDILFGDWTDEQLAEYLASQYGTARVSDDGSAGPRDEPEGVDAGSAEASNGSEPDHMEAAAGTPDDGL